LLSGFFECDQAQDNPEEIPIMSKEFDPNRPVQGLGTKGHTTVDPNKHLPHLTTPAAAVFAIKAEGEFSDKVAIAGFSVSNFGLFGSSEQGVGLFATGPVLAAEFEGSVKVTGALQTTGDHVCGGNLHTRGNHTIDGDIQLTGADYAEDFDTVDPEAAQPGTVMVLDDSGGVRVSDKAYDRRVAGVVSGAGGYRPAVILDRQTVGGGRRPLALMGKVFCRVDASDVPVAIGDLLTTSSTPGHAMKATNPTQAFGAVIGKALRPLSGGRGLVPILVALQ
jgi:hypothetical protein